MLRHDDLKYTRKFHKYNPARAEVIPIVCHGDTKEELLDDVITSKDWLTRGPVYRKELERIIDACQEIYRLLNDDSPRGAMNTASIAHLGVQIAQILNAPEDAQAIEAVSLMFHIQSLGMFPDCTWEALPKLLHGEAAVEFGDIIREAMYKYNSTMGRL